MIGEVGDAIKLHQARRLKEAAEICHDLIGRQPNNADALHLLGVIVQQTGRPDEALSLVRQAIHWQPLTPHYHQALGAILQQLGQLDEALEAFDLALRLNPGAQYTAYPRQIVARIAPNEHKLYRDPAPIRALENFILAQMRAGQCASLDVFA
jgi:tetratricopeptide (TPR) repeat protein